MLLQRFVASITKRRVLRVFATAQSNLFRIRWNISHRLKLGAFMRSVTIRLFLRVAAGAPVIDLPRLEFDEIRRLLSNGWRCDGESPFAESQFLGTNSGPKMPIQTPQKVYTCL